MPRFREVCLRGYRDRVEARSGLSEGANSRFTSPDRQEGSAVLRQKGAQNILPSRKLTKTKKNQFSLGPIFALGFMKHGKFS